MVGEVEYELELPMILASVHLVFYVSMLKNCMGDPVLILSLEGLEVKENLSCKEVEVIYCIVMLGN